MGRRGNEEELGGGEEIRKKKGEEREWGRKRGRRGNEEKREKFSCPQGLISYSMV